MRQSIPESPSAVAAAFGSGESDPERRLRLKECCDLLLAGGYFRCRLPTLSAFDKVVGGLCWSITASGVDVAVDVIFTENSTIGQKIRTADTIVAALTAMRCPSPLQSHQIQGLDYHNLFPCIQWLVRRVLETRRLTGDTTRLQSVHEFSRDYAPPSEPSAQALRPSAVAAVNAYGPQRKFRAKAGAAFGSLERRIEATLLEYGERIIKTAAAAAEDERDDRKKPQQGGGSSSSLAARFDPSRSAAALEAKAKEAEEARRAAAQAEAARYDSLQQQLAAHEEEARLSGASVGSLVGRQSSEIRQAMLEYEERRRKQEEEEVEMQQQGRGRGGELAFARQRDGLRKRQQQAEEARQRTWQEAEQAEARLAQLQADVSKRTAYIHRIHRETDRLTAQETASGDNGLILASLKQLVSLNERLKQQEAAFRASCLQQREQLLSRIKALSDPGASSSAELKRVLEVEQQHAAELQKVNRLRRQLATVNQAAARTARLVDDSPSRAELLQYEKRFVELYRLVAEKLQETRKYYSLYNTLRDSLEYQQSEKTLLESIIAQYPLVSARKQGKEQFVSNMETVLSGVNRQREAKEKEMDKQRQQLAALQATALSMQEKQRAYFKAVRDFQEECYRNEKLLEMQTQLTPPTADSAEGAADSA